MNAPKLLWVCVLSAGLSIACEPKRTAVQPSTMTTTRGAEVQAPPAHPTSTSAAGVLPAGASITVRTIDVISTETSQTGSQFEASLASSIRDANGRELVPAGARLFGRVVEARDGGAIKKPRLEISLSSIETPSRTVSIVTTSSGAEGGSGGAVKKVGAGTLIGAAAGSAGAGAAVGGAAVLLGGGKHIAITPGTLVEFKLTQPATLK
jgi:hypothetical protein